MNHMADMLAWFPGICAWGPLQEMTPAGWMLCSCIYVLWLDLVLRRVNFNAISLKIPTLPFTCFCIPFLPLASVSRLQGTRSRMASVEPPLPQGAGYGVLLGLGLFFAVSMVSPTLQPQHPSTPGLTPPDRHNLHPPPLQERAPNLRDVHHSRPLRKVRPRRLGRRLLLDLGRDAPAEHGRVLPLRRVGPLLVRVGGHGADTAFRDAGGAAEEEGAERAYFSGGGEGEVWGDGACCVYCVWADDE